MQDHFEKVVIMLPHSHASQKGLRGPDRVRWGTAKGKAAFSAVSESHLQVEKEGPWS